MYSLLQAGEIPRFKLGRVVRVGRDSLDDYLRKCRQTVDIIPLPVRHTFQGLKHLAGVLPRLSIQRDSEGA